MISACVDHTHTPPCRDNHTLLKEMRCIGKNTLCLDCGRKEIEYCLPNWCFVAYNINRYTVVTFFSFTYSQKSNRDKACLCVCVYKHWLRKQVRTWGWWSVNRIFVCIRRPHTQTIKCNTNFWWKIAGRNR